MKRDEEKREAPSLNEIYAKSGRKPRRERWTKKAKREKKKERSTWRRAQPRERERERLLRFDSIQPRPPTTSVTSRRGCAERDAERKKAEKGKNDNEEEEDSSFCLSRMVLAGEREPPLRSSSAWRVCCRDQGFFASSWSTPSCPLYSVQRDR